MKLNKFFTLLIVALLANQVKAQLTFGNEQFLFNPVMVNPSLAGMHNNQVRLGYDARWLGINGAPQTGYINYDRMFNGNTGWNVSIISDRIGPISSITLANSFSFMINTSAETKLSFGLRHHLTQSTLNLNSSNLYDPSDPLLASDQTGVPVNNFDASLAWMNPSTFMIGFSYRNLIPQPRFRFTNTLVDPILSLQGWYNYNFGEMALEGFALLTTSVNTPMNSNFGIMGSYQHKIGAGFNYSPNNQVGVFTYVKATSKLNIFYNYNLPISDIAKASKQSHGIGISIRMGNETPSTDAFFLQPTNESARTRMF